MSQISCSIFKRIRGKNYFHILKGHDHDFCTKLFFISVFTKTLLPLMIITINSSAQSHTYINIQLDTVFSFN